MPVLNPATPIVVINHWICSGPTATGLPNPVTAEGMKACVSTSNRVNTLPGMQLTSYFIQYFLSQLSQLESYTVEENVKLLKVNDHIVHMLTLL